MSTWTDDELGELLRETFRDHEDPDDADRAVRIARRAAYPMPRRPVLPRIAAAAAAIVIVGGLAGLATYAARHASSGSSSATDSAAAGSGAAPGSGRAQQRPARADVTGTLLGARIQTMTSYGALPSGAPPPRPVTSSIDDSRRLDSLVRLVNGLRGALPLPHACPPTTLKSGYTTLVLRTSDGTWRFTVSDDCASMLDVRRDGREIGTLDATGFRRHLQAIVEAPSA